MLDVKQGALDRILGKVSLAVFEDTVWAVQPVNALGRDLAKEIQNYMKRFLKSADRHLDLERAGQMLKMWRKGYQSQKEKYQRETGNEQEKLSEKMEQLESGLDRLREQQGEFAEKSENFFLRARRIQRIRWKKDQNCSEQKYRDGRCFCACPDRRSGRIGEDFR